jgi:hypothetical protein
MRCSRHQKNSSEGPTGVATGCAAMVSMMAKQQERGHCCPLHDVWWPATEWDEHALHAVRGVLLTDPRDRTEGVLWVEHFLRRHQHQPMEAAVATRGRGKHEQRLEHDAFVYVASSLRTPGGVVRLLTSSLISSRGRSSPLPSAWRAAIACAPAFHRHFVYTKRTEAPSVSALMHILQLWVWEHFPAPRPAIVMASVDGTMPTGRWTWGSLMRCSSGGPMGVTTGCAAMESTMAMQQELFIYYLPVIYSSGGLTE